MFYDIEQFDGFYRISSSEMVFSYLVVGSDRAALIDTGYGTGDLRGAVESITDLPLIIINTHGHCDHVGGNAQFDCPCYMHLADWDLARRHSGAEMRRADAERLGHFMDFVTGEEYNALPEGFDIDAYCSLGTGNLTPAEGGMSFDLGGTVLELVETPGHTAGGISVLWREKRLLFIGDAANSFTWLFCAESTGKASYLKMLDVIDALQVDYYLGGHNPVFMEHKDIDKCRQAALEADYSKGVPFESFIDMDRDPRVCPVNGMTMADFMDPDFCAVVIPPDWND